MNRIGGKLKGDEFQRVQKELAGICQPRNQSLPFRPEGTFEMSAFADPPLKRRVILVYPWRDKRSFQNSAQRLGRQTPFPKTVSTEASNSSASTPAASKNPGYRDVIQQHRLILVKGFNGFINLDDLGIPSLATMSNRMTEACGEEILCCTEQLNVNGVNLVGVRVILPNLPLGTYIGPFPPRCGQQTFSFQISLLYNEAHELSGNWFSRSALPIVSNNTARAKADSTL